MRRRWWVLIAALCGVLIVVAAGWARRGPVYQGRSLRGWIREFDGETAEAHWRAAEAIRHMGPDVVPKVIPKLSQRRPAPEPKWKQWLRDLASRQSVVQIAPFSRIDERGEALAALDALGSAAAKAIPTLEGLLQEKPPDHRALIVLARIGPEAVPVLNRALTNDDRMIRRGARVCLDAIRSHSGLASPKTPEDAEFMRRTCQFNLLVLQAAFREYMAQHSEEALPDSFDSRPPPRLPPGFVPLEVSTTNSQPPSLPPPAPGFE